VKELQHIFALHFSIGIQLREVRGYEYPLSSISQFGCGNHDLGAGMYDPALVLAYGVLAATEEGGEFSLV
jgi:hypothetical protein